MEAQGEACQAAGRVAELMTPRPLTAHADTSVGEVLELMHARRIRHVPITDDDDHLLGIVSQRDLLGLSRPGEGGDWAAQSIGDVMHRQVDTVTPDVCAGAAARHMLRTKRSSLPVVDAKGGLVGILTEADFLRFALRGWPECGCGGVREGA